MFILRLVDWVIADLGIDKRMDIEDAELMRLGFSWTETQNFSIHKRLEALEAGGIIKEWDNIIMRRESLEVGRLSSGFADAETQKSIINKWRKELDNNIARLDTYTLEGATITNDRSSEKRKPKKFIDVLRGIKDGKIKNRSTRNEAVK